MSAAGLAQGGNRRGAATVGYSWATARGALPPAPVNGYLAQRVPSLVLAGSSRHCLNCAVLTGIFPWRTRHPLS